MRGDKVIVFSDNVYALEVSADHKLLIPGVRNQIGEIFYPRWNSRGGEVTNFVPISARSTTEHDLPLKGQ
jgi:hypothetical protein